MVLDKIINQALFVYGTMIVGRLQDHDIFKEIYLMIWMTFLACRLLSVFFLVSGFTSSSKVKSVVCLLKAISYHE